MDGSPDERARLLDLGSAPERPETVAARAAIAPYLEDIDTYMRALEVVNMEANILRLLNFEMGTPTARTFLRRYITGCRRGDRAQAKRLQFLCSYLAELSLLDYDCAMSKPSVVAASCLFLARFTISPNTHPWNLTLQRNTGYKVSDLESCIFSIHKLQLSGRYPGLGEKAIKDKYRHPELERVSAMVSQKEIPKNFLKDIKQ